MSIQATVSNRYGVLSDSLRKAADYLVRNRGEVANRSLRSVAASSGVSPASLSRLARALGFDSYDALRLALQSEIGAQSDHYGQKVRALRNSQPHLLERQALASVENIGALVADLDTDDVDRAVEALAGARRVVLVGALASQKILEFAAYMFSWIDETSIMAGESGAPLGSVMATLSPEDVVLVLAKAPYSSRSTRAAAAAAQTGARVIVITDGPYFPGLAHAEMTFILRSESPQFFSSYAATLVFLETLAGLLAVQAGPATETRMRRIRALNCALDETAEP